MRRALSTIIVLTLALAACSTDGDSGPSSTVGNFTTTTSAFTPTSSLPGDEGSSSTTAAPDTTETTSGRPVAPDFTLELGEGGTYTLSEGAKPVYMVFWAEW